MKIAHNFQDLSGQTFGRWTVIERDGSKPPKPTMWICRCECGTERSVWSGNLKNGSSRSCGCLQREITSSIKKTHGMGHSIEWYAWQKMRDRCRNPKAGKYKYYGGRGIEVCDRWEFFENFYTDMGPKPSSKHSLDRIDSDGNYEPANCRWATWKEQQRNKRNNNRVTFQGETYSLKEWSDRLGVNYSLLSYRLSVGWSPERAFLTPSKKVMNRVVREL